MSESVAERENPPRGNLTHMSAEGMENSHTYSYYQTMDYDYDDLNNTDQMDYVNPFNVPAVRITFIFLYSLVFACCFFGNILVIFVILRHRKMRTVTNFFLANLAAADLCVGIFCVLPNLSVNLSPYWVLGRVMCKLYYFVQVMAYTASISILTVISIERYIAIIYPMRSKQMTTLCLLRVIVIVVWILAAAYGAPYLYIYDIVQVPETTRISVSFCLPVHQMNLKAYVTSNFILWYINPLILMSVMYSKISIVLWRSSRMQDFEKHNVHKKNNKRWRWKKKPKTENDIKLKELTSDGRTYGNVCYSGGVMAATSASSDENTADEAGALRRQLICYQPTNTSQTESKLINAPTMCVNGEHYVDMQVVELTCSGSDENAVDYEDDWPSPTRHNPSFNPTKIKQKYTFKNMNTNTPEHNPTEAVDDKQQNIKNGQYAIGLETSSPRGTKTQLLVPATQKRRSINNRGLSRRSTSRSSGRTANALLARRKVIRLLIAVIVSFATCVLPYHIRVLWQTWGEPHLSFWTKLLPPITFLIFYLNSGLNPILYAFLSDNFRRSLREVLLCGRDGRLRRGMSTMSSTSMRTASTGYITHNP